MTSTAWFGSNMLERSGVKITHPQKKKDVKVCCFPVSELIIAFQFMYWKWVFFIVEIAFGTSIFLQENIWFEQNFTESDDRILTCLWYVHFRTHTGEKPCTCNSIRIILHVAPRWFGLESVWAFILYYIFLHLIHYGLCNTWDARIGVQGLHHY